MGLGFAVVATFRVVRFRRVGTVGVGSCPVVVGTGGDRAVEEGRCRTLVDLVGVDHVVEEAYRVAVVVGEAVAFRVVAGGEEAYHSQDVNTPEEDSAAVAAVGDPVPAAAVGLVEAVDAAILDSVVAEQAAVAVDEEAGTAIQIEQAVAAVGEAAAAVVVAASHLTAVEIVVHHYHLLADSTAVAAGVVVEACPFPASSPLSAAVVVEEAFVENADPTKKEFVVHPAVVGRTVVAW